MELLINYYRSKYMIINYLQYFSKINDILLKYIHYQVKSIILGLCHKHANYCHKTLIYCIKTYKY